MIADAATGGPGGPGGFLASVMLWATLGTLTVLDPDQVFATLVRWLS